MVVLINGRPLSITQVAEKVPAILEVWYPGQEGGTAIAEALFGDINPGGKLPISVPRDGRTAAGLLQPQSRPRSATIYSSRARRFSPSAHGLSYTTFALG